MPAGIRAMAWAAGAHAAAHTHLRDQDRPDGLGALCQKAAEVLDPSRRVQHHNTAPSPQQRGRHRHLGDVRRGLEREDAEHRAAQNNFSRHDKLRCGRGGFSADERLQPRAHADPRLSDTQFRVPPSAE